MPRRAAKGGPVAKNRDDDEDGLGRGEQALTSPRAGDAARQIGMGFLKMADVIDEHPPLAKLFEGGLERFQEIFQAPGALLARSGPEAGASASQDHAEAPSGSKRKLTGGSGNIKGGGGGGVSGRRGVATGAAGSGSCSPRNGVSWSEEASRGRRGTRGSKSNIEAEAWPGLEQALRASKKDVAASAAGRGAGKGAGMRSRPPEQKASEESAKRGRKPSPPVPAAFGFPAAPPPRRAAAEALHRMSALSSSGPRASPIAAAGPREPKKAAAGADGTAGCKKAGSKKLAGQKEGVGKKPDTSNNGAPSRSLASSSAAAKKPKAAGSKVGGADGGDASQGPGDSGKAKGGGAASSDLAGDHDKGRKTGEEVLRRLDARVFRFVEAGACEEEGCEVRDEAHCHRGPGCDCTRNRGTYMWPSELQSMLRHQNRHREWNKKPARGKRVLVEFEDGCYYPGTINTDGDSAKDLSHSKGRWEVLFDDCTRDRFADGAADVMISSKPMPTEISKELYDYYLRHENGRDLLEGVKVVAETKQDAAAGAGQKESTRGKTGANKKGGAGEKRKRHKSSEKSKPRKESPEASRDQAGGASGEPKHPTADAKLAGTSPEATGATGVGAAGTSRSEKKRKHSIATEDEETDVDIEEQETGPSPRKEKERSGGVARRGDDEGGSGKSKSGSVKGNNRSKTKGAGDSGSGGGDGIRASSSSRNGAGTTKKYTNNDHIEAGGTGCGGHSIGGSSISHKMASKMAKQQREEAGVVGGGEGGDEKGDEDSCARVHEDFKGGGSKHKKSKKARREQQDSSNDFSSRGNGNRGDARVEDNNTSGSVYPRQYERDPDAAVLSAPDSPGLGATVVAEGGGGGVDEGGEDDHNGEGVDWVSPTSHAGAASPSTDAGREHSPRSPTHLPQPPLEQQHQHQPKRMTVPEEEESTEEEGDETVRAVDGRLGPSAPYSEDATNTAPPMCRSPGASGRGGSGEANVVPVLQPPSSAATADSTTLSIAEVLVSRLGVLE